MERFDFPFFNFVMKCFIILITTEYLLNIYRLAIQKQCLTKIVALKAFYYNIKRFHYFKKIKKFYEILSTCLVI